MRVALLTEQFPDAPDAPTRGVGSAVVALARALWAAEPSWEWHVLHVGANRAASPQAFGDTGIIVHRFQASRLRTYAPTRLLYPKDITAQLVALKPDLTHVHGVAAAIDGSRFPSLLTVHGLTERDALFRGATLGALNAAILAHREREARARYRHVGAIAGCIAEHLGNLRSQRRPQLHHLPNIVSEEFFREPVAAGDNGAVFVQLGLSPSMKNPEGSIRAVRWLADTGREVTLRLVGGLPGDVERRLRTLARELRVSDRVVFVGRLDRPAVLRALSEARALLQPSFQEVAPLAIAEAAARGVPSIASPVGGIPEMVAHAQSGFLVDPAYPSSIAAAMARYVDDPALATDHGRLAHRLAQRHHPKLVVTQTLDVYDLVAGGPRRARG